MNIKLIITGLLLSVSTGTLADHPYCHAEYFFKNGEFFFDQCGTYYPAYQDTRFYDRLISRKDRYRRWKQWHHEYPNDKLHCRFYPASGHYRLYTNKGLSVEHYFQ